MVWLAVLAVFSAIAMTLALTGARPNEDSVDPLDAELAALRWVDKGISQGPRRDDGSWEVDVVRPDGSMIQVTLDDDLRVSDFDEEYGPAGTPAYDEMTGPARNRAVQAAFEKVGPGQVVGVERDANREIEVGIRKRDGRQIEVELNRLFEVIEVELEDPRDE